MYKEDNYNPCDRNDYDNNLNHKAGTLDDTKAIDRGYNVIYRKVTRNDGKIKNKRIEIYTSSDVGSRIRDAETGEYFPNIVGSKDEDLFYKVALSTGECRSANGSNTLFYLSPQHYASHLDHPLDSAEVERWELKRRARLAEINSRKKSDTNVVQVK